MEFKTVSCDQQMCIAYQTQWDFDVSGSHFECASWI